MFAVSFKMPVLSVHMVLSNANPVIFSFLFFEKNPIEVDVSNAVEEMVTMIESCDTIIAAAPEDAPQDAPTADLDPSSPSTILAPLMTSSQVTPSSVAFPPLVSLFIIHIILFQ